MTAPRRVPAPGTRAVRPWRAMEGMARADYIRARLTAAPAARTERRHGRSPPRAPACRDHPRDRAEDRFLQEERPGPPAQADGAPRHRPRPRPGREHRAIRAGPA